MQGDQKVDQLMRPVHAAIKRHVKDDAAVTDIYNRAYEAVMISMDVKDAEIARLTELQQAASEFIGYIKAGNNAKAHLQMLFLEVLINEESKNGAKK